LADKVRKKTSESGNEYNNYFMFFVYILKCKNDKTYVGCTSNIQKRLKRHKDGQVTATKNILPVKMIFCSIFIDKNLAFNFEKYLKSGSGRAFMKRHLIKNLNFDN